MMQQISDIHRNKAFALLSLESPVDLCKLLHIPKPKLESVINEPIYLLCIINKKRGGKRTIFAPGWSLKYIQKRLNAHLQAYYLWIKPSEVHGFVLNPRYLGAPCNIVANARVHTGKKHVLNIDLKDFFPGISAKRIKELFTSPYFKFNEQIAIALTLLTTYKAILPTGAPTSPVLSNFVCLKLDAELRSFCQKNNLFYTRYADDLTFSSNIFIPQDTIQNIKQLITANGFEVNEKKVRLQGSNRKQSVTGITVNDKVNVDRKLLKKIRAMLHDITVNGLDVATQRHFKLKDVHDIPLWRNYLMNRLEGYINFVGQVRGKDDALYRWLKECSIEIFRNSYHYE